MLVWLEYIRARMNALIPNDFGHRVECLIDIRRVLGRCLDERY